MRKIILLACLILPCGYTKADSGETAAVVVFGGALLKLIYTPMVGDRNGFVMNYRF